MILALRTDGPTTRAWIYPRTSSPKANPIAELGWESGRELSDQLLSKLTGFLREHSVRLESLSGIIIYSGPGSFTSLRIGHTVANALADSLQIPVVGASGDSWIQTAITKLSNTPPGQPALPHYGSEAHITRPKT